MPILGAITGVRALRGAASSASPVSVVTGGTLTSDATYYYRTFTTVGTSAIDVSDAPLAVSCLIVGGGGGGGRGLTGNNRTVGGSGGAGEVAIVNATLSVGSTSVVVGDGGTLANQVANTGSWFGYRAPDSSVAGVFTARGGGMGHDIATGTAVGSDGGSGGSGGASGTNSYLGGQSMATVGTGYGNFGGRSKVANINQYVNAGGGGGAFYVGSDALGTLSNSTAGGLGGDGRTPNSIDATWSSVTVYGGGAGGSSGSTSGSGNTAGAGGLGGGARGARSRSALANGLNGTANTGGGGSGAVGSGTAGTGGSGIVIIRYLRSAVGG